MQAINTGHITYNQFKVGLEQFVSWWGEEVAAAAADMPAADVTAAGAAAAAAAAGQPCWRLLTVTLPVIKQEIRYAELERVCVCPLSSTSLPVAAAAAAAMTQAQQVHAPAATAAARQQQKAHSTIPMPELNAAIAADGCDLACDLDDVTDDACFSCLGSSNLDIMNAAAAAAATLPDQQVHIHRYSIVWHDSYQVPVLYIQAYRTDGSYLSLDDLSTDLMISEQDLGQDLHDDQPIITAVIHPLLRSPCFMLHPCHTADCMKLLMQQDSRSAAAAVSAAPVESKSCSRASSSSGGSSSCCIPGETAAAIAAAASAPIPRICDSGVSELAALDEQQQQQQLLLAYMIKWFSLVARVLGFSIVVMAFVM